MYLISYIRSSLGSFPDKVRGIFNDGGLFGEREGWHLPGFDTSKWATRDISEGLPGNTAGVGFFVTTFNLNIPSNTDIPLSFVFDENIGVTNQPYRAILFVNGWMMGKRVANLGYASKISDKPSFILNGVGFTARKRSSLFTKASWIILARSKWSSKCEPFYEPD